MITVLSYEEWRQAKAEEVSDIAEEHPDVQVECSECDGAGYIECDMGHEHECHECDGHGFVDDSGELSAAEARKLSQSTTRAAYFKDVISQIRRYCAFCDRDFLGYVGPFVRAQRIPGWDNTEQEQAA